MSKKLCFAVVLALSLCFAPLSRATTTLDESVLISTEGAQVTVDSIVTTFLGDILNYDFMFSIGNISTFDASTYFYFYQLENPTFSNIQSFKMMVDPVFVKSAGYVLSANLDDLGHSSVLGGEYEPPVGSGSIVNPSPSQPYFQDNYLIWDYASAIPNLSQSTVMFISSNEELGYVPAVAVGSSYNGFVPGPGGLSVVPEPSVMLLCLFGVIAYIGKKMRK